MWDIPFATFHPMHDEIRDELDMAYDRVMTGSRFIQGEECARFEEEYAAYCGVRYCVGVGNGLDAIYLILRAMCIGDGDEVIIPSNTFIATALAVSRTGARPVFVEPRQDDHNIDVSRIEERITSRTRAVVAVHLQGRPADMDGVAAIAEQYHLYTIEDAAQAHGAIYKGKRVGGLADAAAFSFYPGKNLGALGDGGCITTNNKEIADKVRILGNYGSDYKYHHIYQGVNSRLDELQAAFLSVKLPHLERWNEARRAIARKYLSGIMNPQIILPPESTDKYGHVYHVFVIRCAERDRLEAYLNENGIGTVKHYPIPIHRQKGYADLGIPEGAFPIAERISQTVLSIPMYYGMDDMQIDHVIRTIDRFI